MPDFIAKKKLFVCEKAKSNRTEVYAEPIEIYAEPVEAKSNRADKKKSLRIKQKFLRNKKNYPRSSSFPFFITSGPKGVSILFPY